MRDGMLPKRRITPLISCIRKTNHELPDIDGVDVPIAAGKLLALRPLPGQLQISLAKRAKIRRKLRKLGGPDRLSAQCRVASEGHPQANG